MRAAPALVLVAMALVGSRAHAQPDASTPHRVAGTVHDSIASAPVAGAIVQLISLGDRAWGRSVVSAPDGRFVFDSVPAGQYALGYLHPRLDSLQIIPPVREVRVPGTASDVTLAVPSVAAVARAACADSTLRDDEALFIGRLRPVRDGAPASPGTVNVMWSETIIDQGVQQRRPVITAETDERGAFVICGVPVETPVLVQGVSQDGETGVIEVTAPRSRLLLRDLFTAPANRVRIVAAVDPLTVDSALGNAPADSLTRLRGLGRLRGAVRTAAGAPLAGARVTVRETLTEAVTDGAGRFELQGLPLGTHAFEAIAIGYAPIRLATDIGVTDTARLTVTMSPVDITLDEVRVIGERTVPAWKRDFDNRRKMGLGRFVDEAAIARRNPMMVSDLLVGLPGITIRTGLFSSQSQLLMRDGQGGYCAPDIVIDGMPVNLAELGIDSFVMASRLVGVELYRSKVLRPAEFPIERSCGLIVLWTGSRQERPR